MPRSERRNEAMQFAVEGHLLENLATIRLEGGAEVVDINATELGRHPVRDAGGDAAQPEVIDPVLAPATDDVIPLADFLDEHRDTGGVVLQVAVHGNDVLAARVVEPSSKAGG